MGLLLNALYIYFSSFHKLINFLAELNYTKYVFKEMVIKKHYLHTMSDITFIKDKINAQKATNNESAEIIKERVASFLLLIKLIYW